MASNKRTYKISLVIDIDLPFTEKVISAKLSDARLIHNSSRSKVNIVFTSPPYINVFNYHQNYRAILEKLGWDILKVAQSEFGSNRKNRGNRFKTIIQYCLDMEPEDIRLTNIDNVFLLRHAKRLPVNKRNSYKEIRTQHEKFPIDGEVVYNFIQEIQGFMNAVWYDPDQALKRGSFI